MLHVSACTEAILRHVNTKSIYRNIHYKSKGEGKVHPTTGHEGPDGAYKYSSILSLTSALDKGGLSTPCPGRFTPGKDPVPIVQQAVRAPGPVYLGAEFLTPHQDLNPGSPIASRYTD